MVSKVGRASSNNNCNTMNADTQTTVSHICRNKNETCSYYHF